MPFVGVTDAGNGGALDSLALHEVLVRRTAHDPLETEGIKAGLTPPEVARSLNLFLATAGRHRAYARTWRSADLADEDQGDS